MKPPRAGGGWQAILYTLRKARQRGGFRRMWDALRTKNACKTCALGMGGQLGGMVNESRRFPEVCKKSIQAMAADMQGAISPHFFDDFSIEKLQGFSPRELENAGRLTRPLYAGPLDSHYRAISWEDAVAKVISKLRKMNPDESFFYFSGRSSNEAAFLLQLFARLYGTNNVNNCSYYCHQASGVGLTSAIGTGAGTVTLEDIEHADLLFVIGANPASNHPRLMRSIVDLRRRGGKVIVINPLRETGLVKFKVPSDVRSMMKASTIADVYVQPHIGGDLALLAGIAKTIIERGRHDEHFVREQCERWDEFRHSIATMSWDEIVRRSGVERRVIREVAELFGNSRATIFTWAMGITHHAHGVENVQMIANLALMRGMIGGSGRGLLPLRGHSNVQGVGSMGVVPNLKPDIAAKLEQTFGITLPKSSGVDTLAALERASEGKMKFASCLGGNLYGASPDANFAAEAFGKLDFVVYFSTTLNTGHAWGRPRKGETLILPVLARDEEPQPTTQESMFSYVRLSDGGEARHEGPRSEVDVVAAIAEAYFESADATKPGQSDDRREASIAPPRVGEIQGRDARATEIQGTAIDWSSLRERSAIRQKIAEVIPGYQPIGEIDATKREFHVAGRRLLSAGPQNRVAFATDNGRAKFHVIDLPPLIGESSEHNVLRLTTLRSEGQFNTVVYEEEDIYRGQERRDVILMNHEDMRRMGLHVHDRVTVRSIHSPECALSNVMVRRFDIAPGNAAMYYPEANALVPRIVDPKSRTPSFKSFAVRIERSEPV